MISMDRKYQTRDGRAVRVLCVDRNDSEFPVISVTDDGEICCCDLDGVLYAATETNTDLIEIKPAVVFWVNVDEAQDVSGYESQREAMESLSPALDYLIAARRVELPIEEQEK